MATANPPAKPQVNRNVSVSELFENLGEQELAAVHALYRFEDGLDQIDLASEARLGLRAATEAAEKLESLGLVSTVETNGHRRFSLNRTRLREQVLEAPELFA